MRGRKTSRVEPSRTPDAHAVQPDIVVIAGRPAFTVRALASEMGLTPSEARALLDVLRDRHLSVLKCKPKTPPLPILVLPDERELVDLLEFATVWHSTMSPSLPESLLPQSMMAVSDLRRRAILAQLKTWTGPYSRQATNMARHRLRSSLTKRRRPSPKRPSVTRRPTRP